MIKFNTQIKPKEIESEKGILKAIFTAVKSDSDNRIVFQDFYPVAESNFLSERETSVEIPPEEIFGEDCGRKLADIFAEYLHKNEPKSLEIEIAFPDQYHNFLAVLFPVEEEQRKIKGYIHEFSRVNRLEEKVNKYRNKDEMTGLYNRCYIREKINEYKSKNIYPFSIIIADVDGLKLINETFGLSKGDEVLKWCADKLQSCISNDQLLGRWGEDEFILLLPGIDKSQVKLIGEGINNLFLQENFKGNIPVSLSLGTATIEENEGMQRAIQKAENIMNREKLTQSDSSKYNLVLGLINTLGAKSHETKNHAVRMNEKAQSLADSINLSNSKKNELELLAYLHDIGKIAISEDILLKTDTLTPREWQEIKKHPGKGASIVSSITAFSHLARYIKSHHEKWDGSGYPAGLKGKEIPLLARIVSIVDAFDVMSQGRKYKDPMGEEDIIQEFEDCAGSHFDPALADKFVKILKEEWGQQK